MVLFYTISHGGGTNNIYVAKDCNTGVFSTSKKSKEVAENNLKRLLKKYRSLQLID